MKELLERDFQKLKSELENYPHVKCDNPYDTSCYEDEKTKNILKEIDENRNHSWIKEVWERNKNNLDYTAIFYRGQKFTYKDFFIESYRYAKALKKNGLKKGQEFICCIENTPEFPFLMGAASLLGAVVNLLSADMDRDYLVKIIENADSPFIFVSDKNFIEFAPTLKALKTNKKIIALPLDYSLKNGNIYKSITELFYKLDEEKYNESIKEFNNIINIDEFLKTGEDYNSKVIEYTGLNDPYTVTYTSGSTISNKPKGLVHENRSYITMGRYHDTEISHLPTMKQKTMLALVRTMSDTDFMSSVSDMFIQKGIVTLEPINDQEFVFESMLINKPTCVLTSRSVWLHLMKKQQNDKLYKNIKLPFLLVPMCIGEPLAANEEKVLNKWLRSLKAGVDITKLPYSMVCMSVAGGDSEHGGIFVSIYRAIQSKRFSRLNRSEPIGMSTYGMVDIQALKDDGTYCDFMEPGILVANSPCTMAGYRNNDEGNKDFYITDAYGKTWTALNTYGYIDKDRHVYVKGRVNAFDGRIPSYQIADEILKDTKRIMSCEVITIAKEDNTKVYVAHLEPQMNTSFDEQKVLYSALIRCINKFGISIVNDLYFRVRDNKESFEVTATLKRSFLALLDEGISDKCISAIEVLDYNKQKDEQENINVLVRRK